jgi:hypothetical protein
MDYGTIIFFSVFALIAGRFLYGRLKYGRWTGGFLKGSIDRTVGEIELARGMGGTQKLTVQLMKGSENSEEFVGLVVVSKAALAASMQPYKLSKAQARELAGYLNQAAQ